jgi:hypothetical protein
MRQHQALIIALAVAAGSCEKQDHTSLVVTVNSDFSFPSEMNEVRIVTVGQRGGQASRAFQLASTGETGTFKLPLVYALVPSGTNDLSITVTAYGSSRTSANMVVQTASLSFVPGESRRLDLYLAKNCRGISCDNPAYTCDRGACNRPIAVDPAKLPIYNSKADAGVTSSVNGGTPTDALSSPDAGNRGAPDSAVRDGQGVESRDASYDGIPRQDSPDSPQANATDTGAGGASGPDGSWGGAGGSSSVASGGVGGVTSSGGTTSSGAGAGAGRTTGTGGTTVMGGTTSTGGTTVVGGASSTGGSSARDAGVDVAAECTMGQVDCLDQAPRQCVGGRWNALAKCGGTTPICDPSSGTCVQCTTTATCPPSTSECLDATCAGGLCGLVPSPRTKSCGSGSTCNGTGLCTACTTLDATDCNGNTPVKCSVGGQWIPQSACSGSTPQCRPGDGKCVGCLTEATCPKPSAACQVATCIGNICGTGLAPAGQTCPGGTCTASGACGECPPGNARCKPAAQVIQVCGTDGMWADFQTCSYICDASGSTPACGGVCSPSAAPRCDPGNPLVPQTCNAQGTWDGTTACPKACLLGACVDCSPRTKQCAGVDGLVPQTCGEDGFWAGTTACADPNPVCQGGDCICVDSPVTLDPMEYASDAAAQAAFAGDNYGNTGGTITSYSGYRVHTFSSTGTFTAVCSGIVSVLAVGGGGGVGGQKNNVSFAAGGGGGRVVYTAEVSIPAGPTVATVGTGGAGETIDNQPGAAGKASSFASISASGGGGGQLVGKGGTSGSGKAGGNSNGYGSGGGGGDSAAGANAPGPSLGGKGGDGTANGITGSSVYYGGGGGGGYEYTSAAAGAGVVGQGGTGPSTQPGKSGAVIVRALASDFSSLAAYAEGTIKTTGSYALKVVARGTSSLNRNVTRTLSSAVDLSGMKLVKFDLRAARTGANIKIGLHDASGMTSEITPSLVAANQFQTVTLDLSAIADANKNHIDAIVVTVVNADADNTVYLDNLVAQKCSN